MSLIPRPSSSSYCRGDAAFWLPMLGGFDVRCLSLLQLRLSTSCRIDIADPRITSASTDLVPVAGHNGPFDFVAQRYSDTQR